MIGAGRKQGSMPSLRHTVAQHLAKLREAEAALSKGQLAALVRRELSITEQTYYRSSNEHGGFKLNQVKRLKDTEQENFRLKRAVADFTLNTLTLKETAEGNF
jgi:putative transposase